METTEQDNGKIGKKPDKTNLEDLSEYIQPFTHLFNKKNSRNYRRDMNGTMKST